MVHLEKKKLREDILEKLHNISKEEKGKKVRALKEKLFSLEEFKKAECVMFYVSKGNEVHTHELIKEALKEKKVIVPKVSDKGILCCELNDFNKMHFDCYGILEPDDTITCDPSEIDLIIVPAIVFDKRGYRIGHGNGYYDSILNKTRGKKIGLAYDFQIVDKIPEDEWDIKVDKVVTNA